MGGDAGGPRGHFSWDLRGAHADAARGGAAPMLQDLALVFAAGLGAGGGPGRVRPAPRCWPYRRTGGRGRDARGTGGRESLGGRSAEGGCPWEGPAVERINAGGRGAKDAEATEVGGCPWERFATGQGNEGGGRAQTE